MKEKKARTAPAAEPGGKREKKQKRQKPDAPRAEKRGHRADDDPLAAYDPLNAPAPRKKKKRRKKTDAPAESMSQWRRRFALDRRREDREKEKNADLQRRQEIFRKRIHEADDKKAPLTSRTKGYYPFLAEYPANTDETGCREITPPKKRRRGRAVLLLALAALVFALGFILTRTALLYSREPVAIPEFGGQEEEPYAADLWMRVPDAAFAAGDANAVAAALDRNGAKTAVIPFKDEGGYVYFDVGEFHGMSADKQIPGAAGTVQALHNKGYKTAAYICCFRDTVFAWSEQAAAVQSAAADGDAVWTDNAEESWLNPFSEDARAYLLRLVTAAGEAGFDYIILDAVGFPTDVGVSLPVFPGEADYAGTRNALLRSFVAEAVSAAGDAKTVLAVKTGGLDPAAPETLPPYYGNLLGAAAGTLLADARPSLQPKNVTVGEETFQNPASLPFVFMLAVGDALQNALGADNPAVRPALWVEAGGTLSDALDAAALSRVETVVIW